MLGVCFGYENSAQIRNQWAYMLDAFGVTDVYEHGHNVCETEGFPKSRIVRSSEELPDVPIVLLSPPDARQVPGTQLIYDYTHPVGDALYIAGQNNVHFDERPILSGRAYDSVYVPTDKFELYALVAMSCALFHRRAQQWAS